MSAETVPGMGQPTEQSQASMDDLAVTTITTLAMDAVQAANSTPGHADGDGASRLHGVAGVLRFDPDDPMWPNRDRLVLSIRHASAPLGQLETISGEDSVDALLRRRALWEHVAAVDH